MALKFGDETLTWDELYRRVNRLGNALVRRGVAPGTRVATILFNRIELVEIQLACLTIGAVFVPIMPGSVQREIDHIVSDVDATVIFYDAGLDGGFLSSEALAAPKRTLVAVGGVARSGVTYDEFLARAPETEPGLTIQPGSIAAVRYTSGTTGAPKGCISTQGQLAWAVALYLAHVPLFDDDRATISSPLSAGFGIAMLHAFTGAGISIYLLPKFDAGLLLATIERERITLCYAIETTFNVLMQHPDLATRDLSSIRLFTGNSPARDAGAGFRKLRSNPAFRGKFMNAYGSTEAGGSVTFNMPADIEDALSNSEIAGRTESVGREGMLCRIDCLDDDFQPVAPGNVGQLAITAPSVFSGYWNLPEASEEVLRDGRLLTGDLAYKDAGEFIFLAGRKQEMIKSGGMNVYPAEVELVLRSHPDVIDAAVIGVPDQQWGEKVVAFVIAAPNCDGPTLSKHCAERLAGYKRPKVVQLVDKLPRTETGKVMKRALRDFPLGGA